MLLCLFVCLFVEVFTAPRPVVLCRTSRSGGVHFPVSGQPEPLPHVRTGWTAHKNPFRGRSSVKGSRRAWGPSVKAPMRRPRASRPLPVSQTRRTLASENANAKSHRALLSSGVSAGSTRSCPPFLTGSHERRTARSGVGQPGPSAHAEACTERLH